MANLIADHRRGDTWDGMSFLYEDYLEDGVTLAPVSLVGVSILVQFRVSPNSPVVFQFKTEDESITIPEPLTGEFFFMPIEKVKTQAALYSFDIQFTFPDGTVVTAGPEKWLIYDDYSK